MKFTYLAAAAVAAVTGFAAVPASAAICIGIGVNGAAPTSVACDAGSGSVNYNATTGGYFYNVSGTGSPLLSMPQLLTQSVNIQQANGTNAVIDVYLTQTGLTALTSDLLSAFTSNVLTGATAQISSYYDLANGMFSTATPLQSANFTGIGTFAGTNLVSTTSPWSETLRYTLNFTGGSGSNFNGTANITAVPEPATWAMMLIGFGAVGFTMRRRRASSIPQLA